MFERIFRDEPDARTKAVNFLTIVAWVTAICLVALLPAILSSRLIDWGALDQQLEAVFQTIANVVAIRQPLSGLVV